MTHRTTFAPEALQFYTTAAYVCSYLPGRIARSQVALGGKNMPAQVYSKLVQQGFRRSGEFIYRPHCDHCQACASIRIPVEAFKSSRSQRRAWNKHHTLVTHIKQAVFSEEHYTLYQRYQKARHTGGGMDHDDVEQYIDFLVSTRVNSCLVEFREGPDSPLAGQLRMVSIIDHLDDGLSAVYTFFEPEVGQSFGVYNVLWQIAYTHALGLPYLYLGYWIEQSQKMSYKRRFQPNELLLNGVWTPSDPTDSSDEIS